LTKAKEQSVKKVRHLLSTIRTDLDSAKTALRAADFLTVEAQLTQTVQKCADVLELCKDKAHGALYWEQATDKVFHYLIELGQIGSVSGRFISNKLPKEYEVAKV